jgi:hypothetical protein
VTTHQPPHAEPAHPLLAGWCRQRPTDSDPEDWQFCGRQRPCPVHDQPPAAPARLAQDATAAAGPTPGTAGPAILGRALLGARVWREDLAPTGLWSCGDGSWCTRAAVEAGERGPVREVLLVDPAVARVLEAARRWRGISTAPPDPDIGQSDVDDAEADVWAAVDALGDTTPDLDTEAEAEMDATAGWESKIRAQHPDMSPPAVRRGAHAARVLFGAPTPTQPAVDALGEPAGTPPADPPPAGGPGWDRETIAQLRDLLLADDGPLQLDRLTRRGAGEQLVALLADRDRYAAMAEQVIRNHDDLAGTLRRERDAARAELDTASSQAASRWQRIIELRAELATARRDAAADTLDWAASQWPGQLVAAVDQLGRWAAEIRAGTRPVPGSPEPDGGGDGG